MLKRFALAALLFAAPLAAQEAEAPPAAEPATTLVAIETSLGTITVALESERAPVTTANFLRYADEDRFDRTVFYRSMVMPPLAGEPYGLIQGGTQNAYERVLEGIAHEPTSETGIRHRKGTISMARFAPGTATGDFLILVSDMASLDADPASEDPYWGPGFAAFGHVVDGMEVVMAIYNAPRDPEKGEGAMKGELLEPPVKIIDVRRVAAVASSAETAADQ